jgi:hypothetical protein
MTDAAETGSPAAKRPRRGKAAPAAVTTATGLGQHLGLSRQRIVQLADEGVIARLDDGRFDQDQARLAYLTWLRDPARRSAKSAAASELERAKTRLIQLRIAEREKVLMRADEHFGLVDEMAGLFRTGLSSLPARIAGRDLVERRRIEGFCNDILK